MQRLPDRGELTRLAILLEATAANPARQSDIAASLGITPQAVSEHVRALQTEGLLLAGDGSYRPTARGVQALQDGLDRLRGFVVDALSRVNVVRHTVALAAGPVRAGERVGLFMRAGELCALAGHASPSTGTASHAAEPGEALRVRDLTGMVDHAPGRLLLVRIPPPPSRPATLAAVLSQRPHARTAALDVAARAALEAAGRKPDFTFAPLEASLHACQRGLDVVVAGLEPEVAGAARRLEEENARSGFKIGFEIRDA
ncbi:MAG TPA: winged helix-turn-helix transcriptional regulator [Candidatus Thermoplasmatota archaeon]|nr:winged helix-turn-helix transcriptional regulator [Candidatus Thermoplasmatota archaeon]